MTNKELEVLDKIDTIRRNVQASPLNCDRDSTSLREIETIITEYFEHTNCNDEIGKLRIFEKINKFKQQHCPLDDYDIRLLEAIIAKHFGYCNRNDWTDELKNCDSEYKKFIDNLSIRL